MPGENRKRVPTRIHASFYPVPNSRRGRSFSKDGNYAREFFMQSPNAASADAFYKKEPVSRFANSTFRPAPKPNLTTTTSSSTSFPGSLIHEIAPAQQACGRYPGTAPRSTAGTHRPALRTPVSLPVVKARRSQGAGA